MRSRLTPAADADIQDIHGWYRRQREGLALEFKRALDECMVRIQDSPLAYPKIHGDIRRALLRRFPYCVFFTVEPTEVAVHGVFHGRRDPKVWRSRHDTTR